MHIVDQDFLAISLPFTLLITLLVINKYACYRNFFRVVNIQKTVDYAITIHLWCVLNDNKHVFMKSWQVVIKMREKDKAYFCFSDVADTR